MNHRKTVSLPTRAAAAILLAAAVIAGCGTQARSPDGADIPNDNVHSDNRDVSFSQHGSRGKITAGGHLHSGPSSKPVESKTKSECYVIVHADDVGLCDSVNRATIAAFEQGIVSSASIMVPCPAFEEFAAYAREHPEYDYGIHLTLNAEFRTYHWGPVLGADAVPSLVNSQGNFWAEQSETAAHARADDVERELTAQIERALERNVPLSHLDTHMGTLFTRPDLTEIYVNLALKYDLPILFTRGGRDMTLFPMSSNLNSMIDEIVGTLDKHRLPVLDHIVMHYAADSVRQKRNYYHNAFRFLPTGVSEVVVHLGYDDHNMREVTMSPEIRDGDRQVFSDPATAELISQLGIRIINWKQFRKMVEEKAANAAPSK